jgi:type IV pilus assembly protein PilB
MSISVTDFGSNAISLLNRWLAQAFELQVSDLHFEPYAQGLRLRFRKDGLLMTHDQAPQAIANAVISRLKILANMDIAEKRLPQDGKLRHTHNHRDYDLRISSIPTLHGEKVVVRVLQHDPSHQSFEQLGLSTQDALRLHQNIHRPHGLILFTGPTGSGKTRSLYSCLDLHNQQHLNISTVEDPCEIQLHGINQVNIHEKAGLGFAQVLRALLRQDPDVLMIGEIRDTQTAQIATQAAQTGHLVFSTLHTPDSISAISRLQHMGVERFNITSTLTLVVAQRLLRRLCDRCKKQTLHEGHVVYTAQGCEHCWQGYQGRTGIFELLTITDELRELILQNVHPSQLQQHAQHNGLQTLRQAAWEKVLKGHTSLEEMHAHTNA